MENIFIANGITQLVITPKNESDRQMLLKLVEQGPLEVIFQPHPIGILDKSVQDSLIIRPKKDEHTS